jgi:hypothetical protein
MIPRPGQAHLLLLLLLGLGIANAEIPGAAMAPDAGPVSAPALPLGVECPVRPGAPQRVRVAWERVQDGIRSLVISPIGHILLASSWKEPPHFTCRTSSIDVSLSPEQTISLAIEDGGARVVLDARPLRALLDSLWKQSPGSVLDRAKAAQGMHDFYSHLGRFDEDLNSEIADLLQREKLWSGVAQGQRSLFDLWEGFSRTPRGRKLLDEYLERLRTSAGVPFLLRLEKELGVSYYADESDAQPLQPLLYWQGAAFCVAQVSKNQCDTADTCKGRDVVRCYDTGAKRWGPKRARGGTPSRAPDAPSADRLRGQRYQVSGGELQWEGGHRRLALEAVVRPVPEWPFRRNGEGESPWNLLFSEDGRFAVLVVQDTKLLGYDCPPGRISCGGFEVWDHKYQLRLYSVVFDP